MARTHPFAGFFLFAACTAWLQLAAAQSPASHEHEFDDAERWAQVFDDPSRDAWQKPEEVIRTLDLAPDARVADIGAGTGYFAVRLARALPQGRVYAVDIEPDMVRYLEQRARRAQLDNLAPIRGVPDDPRLPQKVNLALLVNTFHHIEQRQDYFALLRDSLAPRARLAIIDFRIDSPVGPPKGVRIAAEEVARELEAAGYELVEQHPFLLNQYFLVFRPRS